MKEWLEELNKAFKNRKPHVLTIYTGREGMKMMEETLYKEKINQMLNSEYMNRKIEIYRVTHGRYKGQYRFALIADNNIPIGNGGETYFNKEDIEDLARKYFPDFKIEYRETQKALKSKKDAKL